MLERVTGESALGTLQAKLARGLDKARQRLDDGRTRCSESNLKKARKRLQQTATALAQYVHRLGSHAARKKLDEAVRLDFLNAGDAIAPDVTTLRTTLVCPADAAS